MEFKIDFLFYFPLHAHLAFEAITYKTILIIKFLDSLMPTKPLVVRRNSFFSHSATVLHNTLTLD